MPNLFFCTKKCEWIPLKFFFLYFIELVHPNVVSIWRNSWCLVWRATKRRNYYRQKYWRREDGREGILTLDWHHLKHPICVKLTHVFGFYDKNVGYFPFGVPVFQKCIFYKPEFLRLFLRLITNLTSPSEAYLLRFTNILK